MGFLVISCPLLQRDYSVKDPDGGFEIPDDGLGVLKIDFSAGIKGAKNLLPPVSLDVGSYNISGTLEGGGDSFNVTIPVGESVVQGGLVPGLWTITVDALNTDTPAAIIGRGTNTAQIIASTVTSVQITITPLTGNGTLDLRIEYNKNLFSKDTIVATVTPQIDGSSTLTFKKHTLAELRYWTYLNDAVPAGSYVVVLDLREDSQSVWGIRELVLIVEGQITSKTYPYPPP
jgi:hypothetical protein